MPTDKALLVHTDVNRHGVAFARKSALDSAHKHILSAVPAQTTYPARGLNAALLGNQNHKILKSKSHVRAVFTKLRVHLLDTMGRTVDPRRAYMNIDRHLARVQWKFKIELFILNHH